jgi:ribosomal protein L11 methyltransferase
MNVLELSVRADAEGAEAVAAAFHQYAYGGAVIEQTITPERGEILDPARPYTVRAFLLMDDSAEEKRRALEAAVWHLAQLRPLGELTTRELQEDDWAHAWKKFYTLQHISAHIVLKPSWLDYTAQSDEVVIELDPGMAFGTGLHPTTRLCLAALEQYLTPRMRVLDVGTGSGVLAIAAAKLGAKLVDARDIDPIAVETAGTNVEINHVTDIVSVTSGSITTADKSGTFDLITANILAETIAELAPALAHHLAPAGILIASGILVDKAALVQEAFPLNDLSLIETMQEEDWLVMAASRFPNEVRASFVVSG